MLFKRKLYQKLLKWKEISAGSSALLIEGARRIGKSTIVEEFAKAEYDDYMLLDFARESTDIKDNFINNINDLDTFFRNLFLLKGRSLHGKNCVIIFDEVQLFPWARQAIKYLVQDGRYEYIETGSLISIHKNVQNILIPSEEYKLKMYPMDFEEYLWANGVQVSTIAYLKKCFDDKTPVSQSVHNTMKKLFYSYVVVGGMPEVVQTYVDTHDIGRVITNQRDILEQYRLDIAQYAEGNDKIKIRAIFDSIPTQLNEKNRRFYVNYLDKNARLTRYDNSFKWLDDAGVALPCYNVKEPKPPLALNEKHSLFKLFMNDTGLLCAACMDNIQFEILNGRLEINMGSILEDAIALQLKANGFILRYYDSKRHGEVDFVIQNGMRIDLAEVKSGGDYKKHKALDNVLGVEGWSFGGVYVLCADNIETENGITYLPWYLVMFLRPAQVPKGLTYEVDISDLRSL